VHLFPYVREQMHKIYGSAVSRRRDAALPPGI